LRTAVSIAYPAWDMMLLMGLGWILLRQPAASSALSLRLLALGVLCFMAADVTYGYITLHSTYQAGDPVDSMWVAAWVLFAVAGAAQRPCGSVSGPTVGLPARRASWAPYIALAVGFGLLLVKLRQATLTDASLVITTAVLAGLVSVRQFVAQRDLLQTQGLLRYQSQHDGLTGLANRAVVIDRAEQMLARARRTETPMAALYVDIDNFKQINDTFGHAAGDELLRVISSRLSAAVREPDIVGRLGGDEFVILLAAFTVEDAPEIVSDRICQTLREPIHLQAAGQTVSVTASVGIAVGGQGSADELLSAADLGLYEAKHAGKDRFVMLTSYGHLVARERPQLQMNLGESV
jgi:diguanylate cyclase